jgi:diguanylate cyclase (GGDEF)-like protein
MSPEQLIEKILSCPNLPMIPGICLQVLEMTQAQDISADRVAEVMGRDPALAARVLRAANSFVPREVSTLRHAVALLGMRSVSALALGVSLTNTFRQAQIRSPGLDAMWRRCLYSALAGRLLATSTRRAPAEEVFLGGLFQDIGSLGMVAVLRGQYDALHDAAGDHEALGAAEREAFGIDHSAVGVAMAKAWSLPDQLVLPIAYHHCPDDAPAGIQTVAHLVWASRIAANVLLGNDTTAAACQARDVLGSQFGLASENIHELLAKLAAQAQDLAELFEVQVLSPDSMERILAQAQEAFVRTTMEANVETHRLRGDNYKLAQEAKCDRLTGLRNRASFDQVKQVLFDRAQAQHYPLAALFIDADRFKTVNDTYGHAVGDDVLRRLGKIVSRAFGHNAFRFGGEEIVCFLPRCGQQEAPSAAEKIRQEVQDAIVQSNGHEVRFTVSIGVAATDAPGAAQTVEQLVVAADVAMYEAKRAGRNRVHTAGANAPQPAGTS